MTKAWNVPRCPPEQGEEQGKGRKYIRRGAGCRLAGSEVVWEQVVQLFSIAGNLIGGLGNLAFWLDSDYNYYIVRQRLS